MIKHFLPSFLSHLLLLCAVTFSFTEVKTDMLKQSSLPAFIYQPEIMMSAQHTSPKKSPTHHSKPSSTNKQSSTADIEKIDTALLTLLHEAIAARQHYPESALQLDQSGTVKIRFMLHPDGRVMNVALLESSGHQNLDEAALSAVNAASPISHVDRYVQRSKSMVVSVIFR